MIGINFCKEEHLLDDDSTHAMSDQDQGSIRSVSGKTWSILHVPKQSLSKIMNGCGALFFLTSVRAINKALYADMLELWLSREPFFGPKMDMIIYFVPCLCRPTS